MKTRRTALVIYQIATILAAGLVAGQIAGCGGDNSNSEPTATAAAVSGPQFRAYAQGQGGVPQTSVAFTAAGTPALQDEVGRISRDWAAQALAGAGTNFNADGLTMPPLHFALAYAVEAAARGDTLATLQQALPAVSGTAARAGLAQGLSRRISAAPEHVFAPEFMQAATFGMHPGTWAGLSLSPLSANAVAASPNLRLSITDTARGHWAWPQGAAFRGRWVVANGQSLNVAMLRVQGPLLQHAANGYAATGLALPGGGWMIKITPTAPLAAWGEQGLKAAVAEVPSVMATQPASAARTGEMLLPVMASSRVAGLDDVRGPALAMDEVNANLRGLDGLGGTYLRTSTATGDMSWVADGLYYNGSQSMNFVFSALDVFGPGFTTTAGVFTNVTVRFGLPACPAETVDLRPFYLAVVQANGNIAMLARLTAFSGERCLAPGEAQPGLIIVPG